MAEPALDAGLTADAPGSASRLTRIALARVAAQAMGLLWFVYAARELAPAELGELSTGLALVVVLGGLCDLGTTRTVVRHVAARPLSLRANLRRALLLRLISTGTVGALAALVVPVVSDVPISIVLLAAWIAAASGCTEIDFAALRSIGSARAEVQVLVLERVLFTMLAVAALHSGAGPIGVLILYGASNTLSAAVGAVLARRRAAGADLAGRFFDLEGRRTAVASTLMIIAPRVAIVVLLLIGSAEAVGAYAVAQKPIEAISLLVLSLVGPVLPVLRAQVVSGARAAAALTAGRSAGAALSLCGSVLVWLAVDPDAALDLLLGEPSRAGEADALRALALAAMVFVMRGALDLLILAQERAAILVRATSVGLVITVVVAVILVPGDAAGGAAAATAVGELVAATVVVIGVIRIGGIQGLRPLAWGFLTGGLTLGALVMTDAGPVAGLAVALLGSICGLAVAWHLIHALEV